jgi:hypothetical protein
MRASSEAEIDYETDMLMLLVGSHYIPFAYTPNAVRGRVQTHMLVQHTDTIYYVQ